MPTDERRDLTTPPDHNGLCGQHMPVAIETVVTDIVLDVDRLIPIYVAASQASCREPNLTMWCAYICRYIIFCSLTAAACCTGVQHGTIVVPPSALYCVALIGSLQEYSFILCVQFHAAPTHSSAELRMCCTAPSQFGIYVTNAIS